MKTSEKVFWFTCALVVLSWFVDDINTDAYAAALLVMSFMISRK